MDSDTSDIVLGVVIFAILVPILYVVGRTAARIGDVWTARILAPLAPAVEGIVEQTRIRGRYKGHAVMVFFSPEQNVGSGDSATRINAFYIEVINLAGQQDWRIKFQVSGLLGQGPKELIIHAPDEALGDRLYQSGVLTAVDRVSAPTSSYVTVQYEAQWQRLTYTDDVSPEKIPSLQHYTRQLELVAHLVEVNNQPNPVLPVDRLPDDKH